MRYKDIEGILYNYKIIKARIKNLKEDLKSLDDVYINRSRGPADGMPRGSGISNPTAQTVEIIIEAKEKIKDQIIKDKRKIDKIDAAMEALKTDEKEIIQARYIEGHFWADVAAECNYSVSHAKRIRTNAINKMLKVL